MTIAIIPSRYASKRFNGKPLALVAGKPMIQRVYEQAIQADSIDRVMVATDNEQIFDTVIAFGGEVIMTQGDLRSGTDRVWKRLPAIAPGTRRGDHQHPGRPAHFFTGMPGSADRPF